MGSLSFKASVRKLWALLRGGAAATKSGGDKDLHALFFQEREMVATELCNFEAGAAPLAYTSLRDLIPRGAAPRRSRSWDGTPAGLLQHQQHQISWYGERPAISNNLVELAARAYLQPTVVQREQPTQFLHRLWMKLTTPAPAPAVLPLPAPAPVVQPPTPAIGFAGFFPGWLRMSFNFSPSLTWIFRQLRPQSTVLLRN